MIRWFGLAIAAASLGGCEMALQLHGGGIQVVGSGKVTSITRKVGSFRSVALDGGVDLDVTVGPARDATIKGDDNLVGLVKTQVRDNTLHVYLDKNYTTAHGITVTLAAPVVESGVINGWGDLAIHKIHGPSIDLSIVGSGDLKADGSVDQLSANIQGLGDLSLYGLRASNAKVSVTGSGDANVQVSGNLTADVTGSGDISYRGHPSHVDKNVTGSGDVNAG